MPTQSVDGAPARESVPFLVAGIVLHVGYQLFLLRSYESGDLTQVYPIARGSAPVIVALVSVGFLGVRLSGMELLAILVIATGILSLTLVRRADGQRNARAGLLALGTGGIHRGVFVGRRARRSGGRNGPRLLRLGWPSGTVWSMALFLAATTPGVIGDILRRGKGALILGGGASFAAYAIVIWAFTQAPIALVTALRETSIVFALLIGVFVLNERLDLAKLASTMTTLLGAALLRFASD